MTESLLVVYRDCQALDATSTIASHPNLSCLDSWGSDSQACDCTRGCPTYVASSMLLKVEAVRRVTEDTSDVNGPGSVSCAEFDLRGGMIAGLLQWEVRS